MEDEKKFIIHKRSFVDSLGSAVSDNDYNQERKIFEESIEREYEEKISRLIESVPENISSSEKLRHVFDYLLENVKYDHSLTKRPDGTVVTKVYKTYNDWGVESSSKFAPLLVGSGICAGIALLIDDVCSRLNIESKDIYGRTRPIEEGNAVKTQHVWNLIRINDEYKHLDLVYALYNLEDGRDPYDFFLIDDEKLKAIAPHCDYEDQLPVEMITKEEGEQDEI